MDRGAEQRHRPEWPRGHQSHTATGPCCQLDQAHAGPGIVPPNAAHNTSAPSQFHFVSVSRNPPFPSPRS
ncbi:hypothetical protein K456DRAFT_1585299 [Colletotrichum gloeosporioides 23]|nr:hypothetical protein K456DRAFT_1585299 [Colletotrichum gloeosporioides 23]